LKVLLNNLFDNAWKYASEKSVVVVDYSEKQLIFTNKTDSQIEPSALSTVFEPFSGTPGSGHGLGLSIVKRICDIHDWKLSAKWIDNEFAISIEFK
jgi:signal transduction histidine kinase